MRTWALKSEFDSGYRSDSGSSSKNRANNTPNTQMPQSHSLARCPQCLLSLHLLRSREGHSLSPTPPLRAVKPAEAAHEAEAAPLGTSASVIDRPIRGTGRHVGHARRALTGKAITLVPISAPTRLLERGDVTTPLCPSPSPSGPGPCTPSPPALCNLSPSLPLPSPPLPTSPGASSLPLPSRLASLHPQLVESGPLTLLSRYTCFYH